jgi:peptide/nickel transport system permease protein
MSTHLVWNLVVLVLLVGVSVAVFYVARRAIWRDAARELWRRRPIAIVVLGLYLLVAMLDSVSWIGGSAVGSDAVSAHEARSVLARIVPDHREKGYSTPWKETTLEGNKPLAHRHALGTDILGRDVLRLTLKGAKVAILVGGLTSLIAIPLALFFGVAAGYFGKWIDEIVFFVMSTLASMPSLLLLIALIMALGQGTVSVCIALAVTSWVGFCRIARGEVLKLREMDYVHAARALGVSEIRIIVRHMLPNIMHLVVITFVLMFSGLVLSEAVLSWLGIGVDGSWGQMIAQAKDELSRDPVIWWNIGSAGVALFGLLLSMNFVGDAVRDVLDPRTLREGK